MNCYKEDCLLPVEWVIWIDGSLCCDKHAEEIPSYVEEFDPLKFAIDKVIRDNKESLEKVGE